MTKTAIEEETETLRQFVIAARDSATVRAPAAASLAKLNTMYVKHPDLFTIEDVRWLHVLQGTLGVRLESHEAGGPYTRIAKRRGDRLDHCWRCETPVDERFTEICPTCDSKAYHWRICPICHACGCQREGKALV